MKRTAIFLAGATLTVAALGAQINSEAEERYRAKYGRYTQAFEARQKVPTLQAAGCCRNINASFKNQLRESFAEAVFRGKYGRSATAAAAREERAGEANAQHVHMCVELGKCTLMEAQVVNPAPQREVAGTGESYRAKYGRALGPSGKEVQLAAAKVPCEHACCRRS